MKKNETVEKEKMGEMGKMYVNKNKRKNTENF